MTFIETLHEKLDDLHLLKHSFYQAWSAGKLTLPELQTYAQNYYHHVAAFPRYISQIHAKCADLKARQILLGNLIEEEQGDENHPELWQRFVEGLGATRVAANDVPSCSKTRELVEGYFDLVNTDYATGLGALYAYERQTPEVAGSKIDGLKKFYNITDERTLKFFEVHTSADVWHSAECAALIEDLSPADKEKAAIGAKKGAQLLWSFLDGMMEGKELCEMAA
jgi:pyrroloquinoline-quinone synthase